MQRSLSQVLAALGSILSMLGAFMPFVASPLASMSYFEIVPREALVCLVLAAGALAFIAARRVRPVPYLGLAWLLIVLWGVVRFQICQDEFQRGQAYARCEAFSSVPTLTMAMGHLSLGVGLLVVGAVLTSLLGLSPEARQISSSGTTPYFSLVCPKCSQSAPSTKHRSFLGLEAATCSSCGYRVTFGLRKPFLFAYVIVASVFFIHGFLAFSFGVFPLGWLFSLMAAIPLTLHVRLHKSHPMNSHSPRRQQ